ncbi:MAG: DUF1565 domain-containing protein [Candidatus Coatesbacteria bacterium]|nr:DUF1565 domain-containing protein [Candidatus Coatesbacteria bacterium]
MTKTLAFALVLLVCLSSIAFCADYYVDVQNGDNHNAGSGWSDAYATIGKAMTSYSSSCTSDDTIHVAEGIYYESLSFRSRVTLLGGYPAGGGARDPDGNLTIIDGGKHRRPLRFVSASGCLIDGFTIQNGSAAAGGAVYCDHSSPEISHCTISDNAAYDGGGLYLDGSSPTLKDCKVVNNSASANGGGLFCDGSSPTIWDTVIHGNSAGQNGGGMFCDNSSPRDTKNCLITENTAGANGGGVFCDNSSPRFLNSTLSLNGAGGIGGALFLGSRCSPVVINSILWGDQPDEIWGHKEKKNSIDVTYSNVNQDGFGEANCEPDANGNINCDPRFEAQGGGAAHDGYFLDQIDSPSVSTGDTEENPYGGSSNAEYITDPSGYLDMTGGDDVDMGYHYKEASAAYIELSSFEARAGRESIILTWETATEIDNAGFVLFRVVENHADHEQISGLIPAAGSAASGAAYKLVDRSARPGLTYLYYLIDIDTAGTWTVHGPASARWLALSTANCQLRQPSAVKRIGADRK